MKKIAVYLDNCCFNRPYDDQSQLLVSLETKAKLYVQKLISEKKLDFVYSYVSVYENDDNPYFTRREAIADFFKNAVRFVSRDRIAQIVAKAEEIMDIGIKRKDATHVACAIFGKADVFLTTDKRLLKFKTDEISLMDPMDFVKELEGSL